MNKPSLLLAAAALGLCATSAEATVVTQTFTIKASDFAPAGPVDPVIGSFKLTYDKDAAIIPQTATGLTISGFNLPYDGTALFSYQKGGDFLTISNAFTGFFAYTLGGAGNKFGFTITNLSTAPKVSTFAYSQNGAIYNSSTVALTPGAVPEPATWAMMIAGFGVIGGTMRSRRSRLALA